jgi:hypothetical protein
MSFFTIRNELRKKNQISLLDNLPSNESMKWVEPPPTKESIDCLPEALVIGTDHNNDHDIVAYIIRRRVGLSDVRYCSKPKVVMKDGDWVCILQEDVISKNISTPFIHNNTDNWKFTLIIKWFFLSKGVLDIAFDGDSTNWYKAFVAALRNIANASKSSQPRENNEEPQERTASIDRDNFEAARSPHTISVGATTSGNWNGSSQGTKRTTDDAAFEEIRDTVRQDMELTNKIDDVDQELKKLELEKANFLAVWEKDWAAMEREGVRKRIKRLGMALPDTG